MNIAASILKKIEEIAIGEPFTSKQFLGMGLRANIDQTLCRLIKKGIIIRIARGVFVRPKENQYTGKVMPEPEKVVEAYARSNGVLIQVHGAEAARSFELTTQVPVQPVFYTSGPSKKIQLGKLNVTLKHVSSKKMILPGTKVGLAISALQYLGKENVNLKVIDIIKKKMLQSEFEKLKMTMELMPSWMANVFYSHERENR